MASIESTNPSDPLQAQPLQSVNQCPISKAQCEQLLASLNTGGNLGDGNHVATVSTVTASTGVEGTSDVVSYVASTSS
nr:hypothetical protein CFP56_15506 [Quercus suber]